jgi:hypothetical protein
MEFDPIDGHPTHAHYEMSDMATDDEVGIFVKEFKLVEPQSKGPCQMIDGGSQLLNPAQLRLLASRYRSWEIRRQCPADVDPYSNMDPRALSVTIGDYDADGKPDVAVLMQSRNLARTDGTIVVAFMTSLGDAPVFAGRGSLFVATNKKGEAAHDFSLERDFTFTRDAIFTGDFHCCGDSLLFTSGRFIRIPTSD